MRRLGSLLVGDRVVLAVIVLDAIALLMLGSERGLDPRQSPWFWIDYGCVTFFLIEAVAKIITFGWNGYRASPWNRFDAIVVVASLPVLVTPWIDLHDFGVVMLLRLGRLFRLFRLLTFIPHRDHLVGGIRRALKASVGVFLALATVNVIFAAGASFLFGELAPEHFSNPLLALYSIFKIFTVEGWYEIPDLIAERAEHPLWAAVARAYFVMAVSIGGILGLSLANAVFVDEMTIDNTRTLEDQVAELTEEVRALRREVARSQERPPPRS